MNVSGAIMRTRLAAFVFGLIVAGMAVATLVSDFRSGTIKQTAERLRAGAIINEAALLRLDQNRALRRAEDSCRHINAAIMIRKSAVDQITRFTEPQFRDAALDALEMALRRALLCEPVEGRHWLSLAQVRLVTAGPGPRARSALDMASWTRSAESDVLIDRIAVLQWLHDIGIADVRDLLARDLGVALRHLDVRVLEQLYLAAQESTRDLYQTEIRLVPEERRKRLQERLLEGNAMLRPYLYDTGIAKAPALKVARQSD